jgi:hypothetical protein
MSVSRLAKKFFRVLDEQIGPFDRPFQFRIIPFDSGGSLNFLSVTTKDGAPFVTYVSWDLFGHEKQKRGKFGRYELMATCDDGSWCFNVLTMIGRHALYKVIDPGDTFDIGPLVEPGALIQGVVFEAAIQAKLFRPFRFEPCGVMRCLGVTRPELEFAIRHGTPTLVERLKRAGIYPRIVTRRSESVDLTD